MTLRLTALPRHYCVVHLNAAAPLPAGFSLAGPLSCV